MFNFNSLLIFFLYVLFYFYLSIFLFFSLFLLFFCFIFIFWWIFYLYFFSRTFFIFFIFVLNFITMIHGWPCDRTLTCRHLPFVWKRCVDSIKKPLHTIHVINWAFASHWTLKKKERKKIITNKIKIERSNNEPHV